MTARRRPSPDGPGVAPVPDEHEATAEAPVDPSPSLPNLRPADDGPPAADDAPPGADDAPPAADDAPPGADDAPPGVDDAPPGAAGERPTVLRLAGVHLRTGLLHLARAELEALAHRRALDDAGLADLAEARWRTGDLDAAGAVATELVERGSALPLMLAIAAEAVAADGRTTEARRLATRATAAADGSLSALFAGLPRHDIWPDAPSTDVTARAVRSPGGLRPPPGTPGDVTAPVADRGATPGGPATTTTAAATGVAAPAAAATAAAAGAFAGGRASLAGGDHDLAAVRLGVALRLDPGFAGQVLEAVGTLPTEPSLALLAGDALRILGREPEALVAFDVARGAGMPGAGRSDGGGQGDDEDAAADPDDAEATGRT